MVIAWQGRGGQSNAAATTMSEAMRDRVARLLYREVRKSCDGYVEPLPEGVPVIGHMAVDGYVDFQSIADALVKELHLS